MKHGYGHGADGVANRAMEGERTVLDERPNLKNQALNLVIGEFLGEGAYRRVYALRHSPDLVLKLDYDGSLTNAEEWLAWCELSEASSKWADWLAPCVAIDEFTGALIQKRCRPLTDDEWEALTHIPSFLGDARRTNWGWYEPEDGKGRPVMFDYAINHLRSVGTKHIKMIQRPA